MELRLWNAAVLVAAVGIWLATETREARPVFADAAKSDAVRVMETDVAQHPTDGAKVERLAQSYLDNHAPGLAVALVESAPAPVQAEPRVGHLYARALVEQGRDQEALRAEERVLQTCGDLGPDAVAKGCDPVLVVSAARRTDILQQLVNLGVEDAQAQPDEATIAYHRATREARVAVQ